MSGFPHTGVRVSHDFSHQCTLVMMSETSVKGSETVWKTKKPAPVPRAVVSEFWFTCTTVHTAGERLPCDCVEERDFAPGLDTREPCASPDSRVFRTSFPFLAWLEILASHTHTHNTHTHSLCHTHTNTHTHTHTHTHTDLHQSPYHTS